MKTIKEKLERRRIVTTNGCWDTTYQPNYSRPLMSHGRRRKNIRVARAAYEVYIGPIPGGLLVCHTCDNPRCHNPEHLFLGTHGDNTQDMWDKGRGVATGRPAPPGALHHKAKLTEEQAREIRSSVEKGVVLSSRYNVSNATISRIKRGRLWKHQHCETSKRLNP